MPCCCFFAKRIFFPREGLASQIVFGYWDEHSRTVLKNIARLINAAKRRKWSGRKVWTVTVFSLLRLMKIHLNVNTTCFVKRARVFRCDAAILWFFVNFDDNAVISELQYNADWVYFSWRMLMKGWLHLIFAIFTRDMLRLFCLLCCRKYYHPGKILKIGQKRVCAFETS